MHHEVQSLSQYAGLLEVCMTISIKKEKGIETSSNNEMHEKRTADVVLFFIYLFKI